MKQFIVNLFFFSLLLAALIFCWNQLAPLAYKTNLPWYLLAFFFFTTAGIHAILLRTAQSANAQNFVRAFMLSTVLKFFFYLLTIIVVCFLHRNKAVKFILSFLVLYIPFLIFEAVSLMRIFSSRK
jgi:hypothetical protein